jgi:general secretion pathway protein B
MSYILDALKKSEQQRQQQKPPQKKVRKRILSLQSYQSSRRLFPCLFAGLLLILFGGGWWLFHQPATMMSSSPAVDQPTSVPVPFNQSSVTAPVVANPSIANSPQEPLAANNVTANKPPEEPPIIVEPAPIPRPLGTSKQASPAKSPAVSDNKTQASSARLATVIIDQPEPQDLNERTLETLSSQFPLYSDLSKELRNQMPSVNMSMHYYNNRSERRLVRINDRLLREGDWVERDLQLVEITETGALLDYLGKTFELRGGRR